MRSGRKIRCRHYRQGQITFQAPTYYSVYSVFKISYESAQYKDVLFCDKKKKKKKERDANESYNAR